jgi:hypothetical protein
MSVVCGQLTGVIFSKPKFSITIFQQLTTDPGQFATDTGREAGTV